MKKLLTIVLAVLVFNLALVSTASAATDADKAAKRADKVKAGIQKLGVGKDSRIEVTLNNGTKLKGYVSEIKDGSFVVTSDGTNAATEVPYPNAKKVHKSSKKTLLIVAAAVVGGFVVLGLIFAHKD
ncbi:MAG: hypothetical protein ACJ73D_08615 [Pyrinomonadaceae bacterium]